MTLRLRLALGLAALLVVGLGVFGIATYSLYAPSELGQLDTQLENSVNTVCGQLEHSAHIDLDEGPAHDAGDRGGSGDEGDRDDDDHGPPPQVVLAPGSYAELISPSGRVVANDEVLRDDSEPQVPRSRLRRHAKAPQVFTTASVRRGGPSWRVLVTGAVGAPGYVLVVAEPTTALEAALHHLVVVEAAVAALLLAVLLVAALVMLRAGLSPLEQISHDSHAIAAGDLSRRVGPRRGPKEVIELGEALNSMLGEIETSFEERLQSENRLRQFLADASHELRTPLTSIQGFAELFRLAVDGKDTSVDATLVARRIEGEAGRMKRLVDDLLLLARLDQAPGMHAEDVELTIVVADACGAAAATDPSRPISLDAPAPVVVKGDRDHLQQAVTNLLGNALKHTPAGTPIEVGVLATGGLNEAVVTVRDHGPGLDEETRAHLFDRFWQADTSRAGEGLGLGLAIVAAIVAEHGGRIEVDNADGGGAIFTLRLPVRDGPPAEAAL